MWLREKVKRMLDEKYIFHVHTQRCGHAENIGDEVYIKRAVELGAESIYFTDHAPFPGDPFRNRMKYEQLTEYISTLNSLRNQYQGIIDLRIGLEIEYLPSFRAYYDELKGMEDIELLVLGQHHSELESGFYTFEKEDKSDEWKYLMEGQILGAESEYFDIIAHPDRLFKREKRWSDEMSKMSMDFIDVVIKKSLPIEKNLASMQHKRQYWEEFWELVSDSVNVVTGCDAHAVDEIVAWWE